MATIINIGMNTNDGDTLSMGNIMYALYRFNVGICSYGKKQSNTEPMFIAQIEKPLSEDALYNLALYLRQDAIAQCADGVGILIGPHADKWGEFNPEYFLTLE